MGLGIAVYLAVINAMAFLAFASDKRRAVAGIRRTPEQTLLGLAAIGGSIGALAGQQMFRHKTRKEPFRTILWSIVAIQLGALVGWRLL
jgi:uncharacterized membrane protein YsdA (DUF1294 family)